MNSTTIGLDIAKEARARDWPCLARRGRSARVIWALLRRGEDYRAPLSPNA
jgi:hypothetical protein